MKQTEILNKKLNLSRDCCFYSWYAILKLFILEFQKKGSENAYIILTLNANSQNDALTVQTNNET